MIQGTMHLAGCISECICPRLLQSNYDSALSLIDLQKLIKEKAAFDRERRQQKAIAEIKKRYGKNAILKGMNLEEAGTTKDRNEQIGGHKA